MYNTAFIHTHCIDNYIDTDTTQNIYHIWRGLSTYAFIAHKQRAQSQNQEKQTWEKALITELFCISL